MSDLRDLYPNDPKQQQYDLPPSYDSSLGLDEGASAPPQSNSFVNPSLVPTPRQQQQQQQYPTQSTYPQHHHQQYQPHQSTPFHQQPQMPQAYPSPHQSPYNSTYQPHPHPAPQQFFPIPQHPHPQQQQQPPQSQVQVILVNPHQPHSTVTIPNTPTPHAPSEYQKILANGCYHFEFVPCLLSCFFPWVISGYTHYLLTDDCCGCFAGIFCLDCFCCFLGHNVEDTLGAYRTDCCFLSFCYIFNRAGLLSQHYRAVREWNKAGRPTHVPLGRKRPSMM